MNALFLSALALSAAVSAQGTTTVKSTKTVTATTTTGGTSSTLDGSSNTLSTVTISAGSSGLLVSNSINGTSTSSSSSRSISASAQTTISLFNACSGSEAECGTDSYTYYGGVVSANPTRTILAIDCASSGNLTACGSSAITVTQGASEYQRVQSSSTPGVVSVSCKIESSTSQAVCVEAIQTDSFSTATAASGGAFVTGSAGLAVNSANGTATANAAQTTTIITFGSDDIHYNALVITAGAEKLSSTSSSATRTPVAPTTVAPAPTHTNAAAGTTVTTGSLAGVIALVFSAFFMA